MPETQATVKPDPVRTHPRGIIFIIISSIAFIVLPAVITASIIITVLLQPGFYTGILKDGKFITAFVQARNWQVEKQITDEIERDVQLTHFTKEYEKVKSRYEDADKAYVRISRNDEVESLKKQLKDLKDLEWKEVKDTFPDEDAFDKNRKEEIEKIKKHIASIEEYQDQNSDSIKAARKEMKKAKGDFEDALSMLEDKKKDAEKIAEKHKNTVSGKIYADLERIERPLSRILNTKLIDGAVRSEIEKMLRFLTSYETQVEEHTIYYTRSSETEGLTGRSLRVKLPEIAVSLWVSDDSPGRRQKKHIVSQLLVEELDKVKDLQNRTLLKTIFRLSDTSLGEYFTGKYLGRLGLSIDDGVIRLSNLVLKDEQAEFVSSVMETLSWAQYAVYGAAGILLLFIMYLAFSTVERNRKLAMLKRLFIYPSLLVLIACGALVWTSLTIVNYYPELIHNLSMRSYVKHLGFTAAWHFIMPISAVFGGLFFAGLIIRKLLAIKASRA